MFSKKFFRTDDDLPCVYIGGELDGTAGLWNPARGTRCLILETPPDSDDLTSDGRHHVTCVLQTYRPLANPEFDKEGNVVLRLAGQIENCNHELH